MSIVDKLRESLDASRVITDEAVLNERRHDYWVMSHLDDVQDRPAPAAACVVRPATVADVSATLRACSESGTAVIPFGLGSGVCGGVIAHPESVLIDLSAMNATRTIDETNLLASFDAGKNGGEAEREVAERGLTIGHWPQSIDVSSVGGWIATRASGQFSTAYGNIEDIVYQVEAVLPNGDVVVAGKGPRAAAGPDLRHVFLGSEGTMGVITGVTFSLRRAPESRAVSAFYSSTMRAGFEVQREIIQQGYRPPVMRQYDAMEANRNFPDQGRSDSGMFIAVHEGPATMVDAEKAGVAAIAEQGGLAPAPEEAVTHWLKQRNHVPTWEGFLNNGIVLDTIEISATWSTIADVYDTATKALADIPGVLAGTAHSSHGYRSGLNLYFTFAARPENADDMADTYTACWKAVMESTAAQGGSIAHHHGIGRVRKNYLERDLGAEGVGLLRTMKQAIDPKGIMNPGVLLPDA